MNKNDLENFLKNELTHILYMEERIIQALPEVINAADSDKLKSGLKEHLNETRQQVQRVKKALSLLNGSTSPEKCEVTESLIQACQKAIQGNQDRILRDIAICSKCQAIEHFEIARYGGLCAICKELELTEVGDLLHKNLEEEKGADKALSKISEGGLISSGLLSEVNK